MSIKGSSSEIETIVMAVLVSDPYVVSKVVGEIEDSYFTNPAYRIIYNEISKFYSVHWCLPSKLVLSAEIRKKENLPEDIFETIDTLFNEAKNLPDDTYATEEVFNFVTRARSENVLSSVVDSIRSSGSIDSDKVMGQLQEVYNFRMDKLSVLTLSDVKQFQTVKREALGDEAYPQVIRFFVEPVNNTFQYGGLIPGTLNCVAAPPGRGKTSMLINQGAYAATQGFNTLHVFLGDMSRWDGLMRYVSTLTGYETKTLTSMSISEIETLVEKFNKTTGILDRVTVLTYPADTVSANGLMEDIKNLQRDNNVHFAQIIVDYDENIRAEDSDSMYNNAGILYNKLAAFAITNKSVVWIASQPKVGSWGESEILPMECLSESSKKQKICDTILTLGKNNKISEAGTLFIAKNRRGTDGKLFRLSINGATCQMKHISEEEYENIKSKEHTSVDPTPNKNSWKK